MKQCSKCGASYPATTEYFYRRARSTDGLTAACKPCVESCNKRWKVEHPQQQVEYKAKYRRDNREKLRERNRHYYVRNLAQRRESNKEFSRRYRLANIDKVRADNRARKRASLDTQRVHQRRRESRKHALPTTLTPQQWESILAAYGYACAYCGKAWHEIDGKLHQEHVIPISQGGGYTADNIVPSCKSCNSHKANRTPEQANMTLRNI